MRGMVSKREREDIVRRIRSGESYRQIREATGRSHSTVCAIAKAAGVRRRHKASTTPGSAAWVRGEYVFPTAESGDE